MRFVIDENVSYGLIGKLREAGHEIFSISESKERGVLDTEVFNLTKEREAILLSRDYHFTNSIRFPADEVEAIIYIRCGNLSSKEEISIMMKFLKAHPLEEFRKSLVILYKDSIKIRK